MNLKSKNVFVTGADGFIGSHLVELLVKRGANVRALSQYNSFNNWGWLEDIDCKNDVEVVCGDIRDAHCVKKFSEKADVIFHLAALIAIPYSYVAPDSYVDTNVKGTLNVCQAALENGVSKVVHTSTSEVYGTAKYVPIDEKHPIQPQSPYSATKIGADCIAESFHRAFGLPLATAAASRESGCRRSNSAQTPNVADITSGTNASNSRIPADSSIRCRLQCGAGFLGAPQGIGIGGNWLPPLINPSCACRLP